MRDAVHVEAGAVLIAVGAEVTVVWGPLGACRRPCARTAVSWRRAGTQKRAGLMVEL
jgi:hypothetical protein